MNLSAYELKADVTANTNGLKTADRAERWNFKFRGKKDGK